MNKNYFIIVAVILPLAVGCRTPLFDSISGLQDNTNQLTNSGNGNPQTNPIPPGFTGSSNQVNQPGTNPATTSMVGSPDQSRPTAASNKAVREIIERGHDAFQRGNMKEAKSTYMLVLRMQPNHTTAHHRLAVIADIQKDYPSAEQHYLAAIRSNPQDANLMSDIGYSYLLQKRFEDSEHWLKKTLQLAPTHQLAQTHLDALYQDWSNSQPETEMFQRSGNNTEVAKQSQYGLPNRNAGSPHAQQVSDNRINSIFSNIDNQNRPGIQAPNPNNASLARHDRFLAHPNTLNSRPTQYPAREMSPFSTSTPQQVSHQYNAADQRIDATHNFVRGNTSRSEINPLNSMPSWPPAGTVVNTSNPGNPTNASQVATRRGSQSMPTTSPITNVGFNQQQMQPNSGTIQHPVQQAIYLPGQPTNANRINSARPDQDSSDAPARAAAFLGMNAGFSQPFPMTPSTSAQTPFTLPQSVTRTNPRLTGSQFTEPPRSLPGQQPINPGQYPGTVPSNFNQPVRNGFTHPSATRQPNQLGPNELGQWPSATSINGTTGVTISPAGSVTNQKAVVTADHWNSPIVPQSSDPLVAYEEQIQQQNAQINDLRSQLLNERNQMQQRYSPGQSPAVLTQPAEYQRTAQPPRYNTGAFNQATNR